MEGVFHHGLPQQVDIHVDALQVGRSDERRGVRPDHGVSQMTGRGPFGQPAALAVGIGQPLHDAGTHLRIEEVEEGVNGPEGVPETIVRIHQPRLDSPVVGTVMKGFACSIVFVELSRVEQQPVEAGIEGTHLVQIVRLAVGDPETTEVGIPHFAALAHDIVERPAADLALQVPFGLLPADERRGGTRRDLFAIRRMEGQHDTGTLRATFIAPFDEAAVAPDRMLAEGAVEDDHEIGREIVGLALVVSIALSRKTDHLSLFGNHLDTGIRIEGIDDDPRPVALREGEAEGRRAFGR